jgi:hypothetical protein
VRLLGVQLSGALHVRHSSCSGIHGKTVFSSED